MLATLSVNTFSPATQDKQSFWDTPGITQTKQLVEQSKSDAPESTVSGIHSSS